MKNLKYVLFTFFICFISLSNVYADATCVYKVDGGAGVLSTNFDIICQIDDTTVNCSSDNNNIKIVSSSVETKNFKNGKLFICPNNIYISMNNSASTPSINLSSSYTNGYIGIALKENESTDDSSYASNSQENTDDNSGNATTPNNSNKGDTITDYEKEFCTGPVQGVFTTLGWVFFILKIAVPVILIIFGSIDFAKAVLASKDDEIKKSIKTLVMRAIAGVIIFFIPTILNFAVKLIDKPTIDTNGDGVVDAGVYRGTFMDCTKCMLEPNDNSCSGLGGN